ncbi:MAG: glycosyltransferase [Candidatus Hydrogenedentes bacterium]|nr:glycosyltransferase [Candidatus Hydrogenedentota bacterium]
MRALMLTTQLFATPLDGGALRSWHILRQAAKRHEITVLGMYCPDRAPSAEELRRIQDIAASVIAVERPVGRGFRAMNALNSLCIGRAYNLANYSFPAFAKAISEALRADRYDLVHAHHIHTAQYRALFAEVAAVYDAQNIYSELWRGYAAAPGRRALMREIATRQAALVAAAESRAFRDFDVTAMCSDADRERAVAMAPEAPIHTLPNGVDCEYFAPDEEPEEPFSLVFTGAMEVPANVDACDYLVTQILPIVLENCPETKLYLVGKDPVPAVQRLARSNVIVTGSVPDVRPYQSRAQVAVAPIRMGSGTRLKILEAMAMRKPVIATSLGAEGIGYTAGKDILIADSPEDFAAHIGRLFADPGKRRRLGEAARRLVVEQYDWNLLESKLDDLYHLAVSRAAARSR